LKCESCLLCEKACPPRAITIEYAQRDSFRPFRRRPPFRPKAISGFYRPRLVSPAAYEGPRPLSPAVDVPREGAAVPAEAVAQLERIIVTPRADDDLVPLLEEIQENFGYLPRWALARVAAEVDVPISDLYSMATLGPRFRLRPATEGGAAN
nr:NAD(P)H-dependent oxidoreductase subunit E [Dehalococcoidales bacterium]